MDESERAIQCHALTTHPLLNSCQQPCLAACAADAGEVIVLGSKKFTESFVLSELAKRSVEEAGFHVEHRQGTGGTIILWEALRQGSIAAYPDYTGTIQE